MRACHDPRVTRPGFLHTSPVHVPTFDTLLAELDPATGAVHLVDESLLADARTRGAESVTDRVSARITELRDQGAGTICCTCSSIGDVAESIGAAQGVPVFRVDRPMAARAIRSGRRIGVVAALASTLAPTRALLLEEAARAGAEVEVELALAEDAWPLFEQDDQEGYLAAIAAAARGLAAGAHVLVLAQASMAGAEPLLADLGLPVLSSPRIAAEHLRG